MDDNETALKVRKLVLELQGYEILAVSRAAQAVDIVRAEAVDLVIADHFLTDAVGTDVAVQMKEISPSLPIILLSDLPDPPEDMRAVDLFVSKVDGRQALLSCVQGQRSRLIRTRTPSAYA